MGVAGKHILIIVENLPLPFDKRVWQEANALKDAGADVSIICPQMKDFVKPYERINDIDIYRHPLPPEGTGGLGYLIEYSAALFWEFFYTLRIFLKKRVHIIHGCCPPDLIFMVAAPFRLLGTRYVFDHHDLSPELFFTKFGKKGLFHTLLTWFERATFALASYSIATNGSFKKIAIERGGMSPEKVQIVRSGPDLNRLRIQEPKTELKRGKQFLIGYLGIIAEQDGLDLLVKIARIIKDRRGDVQFAIMGGGTELENVKSLAKELKVDDMVEFYGMVSDNKVMNDVLNTCDVCVNPDVPDELNTLLTTNKVMEYMAVGKPVVQYDLKEGRFSAEEASLYAKNDSLEDFADKIELLLDNPEKRKQMGDFGRNRVVNELSWDFERKKLVDFYNQMF
ncbi:MAG: glycosyltransferase involved in cell wall biosynthesis [Flavobacteriales bacterium]|jgi:glycosyltransferase involved in cell wall biosynthesis